MEEICYNCDAVVNTNEWDGCFICPDCGAINHPCNRCAFHKRCDQCLYVDAPVISITNH